MRFHTPFVLIAASVFVFPAFAGNVFDIAGQRPVHVLVTLPGREGPLPEADAPLMLRTTQGVLEDLSREEIAKLVAAGGGAKRMDLPADAQAAYTLVLTAATPRPPARVTVFRNGDDIFAAPIKDDGSSGDAVRLDADKFGDLALLWEQYRGDFTVPKDLPKPGASGPVNGVTAGSWVHLSNPEIEKRFTNGTRSSLAGSARVASKENFVIRLPRNYDPTSAAGLIVFIHAAPDAVIPKALAPVADELGFVCISPGNCGNDRSAVERYQLAVDCVQIARERCLIDADRVYMTGLSGGGKITTHVWAAFPEIIMGGVPVVAVGSYEHLKREDGKFWRGDFPKPNPKRMGQMKKHRLAAMTGDKDPNQDYIRLALKVMEGDGLTVKLYDYPDMAHEYATPERFADALRWVDEPAREQRAAEKAKAAELLEAAKKVVDDGAASVEAKRKALLDVMSAGAWSAAAWDALTRYRALDGAPHDPHDSSPPADTSPAVPSGK